MNSCQRIGFRCKVADKSRYTVYGKEIDKLIDSHLEEVAQETVSIVGENNLEAVILCGGYGRGEGGVYIDSAGDENLENDYDFMAVVKQMSRKKKMFFKARLDALGEQLGKKYGIHVDFGPLKTIDDMRKADFTLFNYELKYGHIVIYGDKNILDVMDDFDGSKISAYEALKLLLNRGVGLVLSKKTLTKDSFTEKDNEFVTRNIYKAVMAIGDAAMMLEGCYHYSYLRRLGLMKELADRELIRELDIYKDYLDSMEYKFRPKRNVFDADRLAAMLETAKNKLMVMFYKSAAAVKGKSETVNYDFFAKGFMNECSPKALVKNFILNIKSFGIRGVDPVWVFKYPRYRLFYCLPFLIGCKDKPSPGQVSRALGCSIEDRDIEKRFITLWERYG